MNRRDKEILELRMAYGAEGYGLYIMTLEVLQESKSHAIAYTDEQLTALSAELKPTVEIKPFVDKLIELGLLNAENGLIFNAELTAKAAKDAQRRQKQSEGGKKAMARRWAEQTEPEEKTFDNFSARDVDKGWIDFLNEYQKTIGMFPNIETTAGQELQQYYSEFGSEMMIEAVRQTGSTANKPSRRYLTSMLLGWKERGIKTLQEVRAENERRRSENEQRRRAEQQVNTLGAWH